MIYGSVMHGVLLCPRLKIFISLREEAKKFLTSSLYETAKIFYTLCS